MNKIPTAEEFIRQEYAKFVAINKDYSEEIDETSLKEASEWMIAFTKLHVEAALKTASERAIAKENLAAYGTGEIWVDKQSILNAYPLTNIQ